MFHTRAKLLSLRIKGYLAEAVSSRAKPLLSLFLISQSLFLLSSSGFFSHPLSPRISFVFLPLQVSTLLPLLTTTKLNIAPENLREASRIFRSVLDALPHPISTAWPACYIATDEEEGGGSTNEMEGDCMHKMKKRKRGPACYISNPQIKTY